MYAKVAETNSNTKMTRPRFLRNADAIDEMASNNNEQQQLSVARIANAIDMDGFIVLILDRSSFRPTLMVPKS